MTTDARTVLVSGASGAIGKATVAAFLRAGLRVVGLDRAVAEGTDARYRHVVVELTNESEVSQAVADGLGDGSLTHLVGLAGGALPAEPAAVAVLAAFAAALAC